MTHDEMIAVIQAHKDGKAIEAKYRGGGGSWDNCHEPGWNFNDFDFRVKPEPREWWINIYPPGANEDQLSVSVWKSRESAKRHLGRNGETVRLREVL